MFQKATRKKAKLKIALVGPSGSGKTYSALLLFKGMGGKTAVIDTERGSASLYSHLMDFDVNELQSFEPEVYIKAIQDAVKLGYDNLVIDSLTHEWAATKEIAQKVGEAMKNDWAGWSKATPRHQALVDAILQAPIHIIATMRAKTEWAVSKDEKSGKTKPVKLGVGADQRQGMEFEYTTVFNISSDGNLASVDKDRTNLFVNFTDKLSEKHGEMFKNWLDSGVDAPAKPVEDPLAGRKNYLFLLMNQLDMKYEGETKEKFQKFVGKESMRDWDSADLEKVVAALEKKILDAQKNEIKGNK